MPEETAQVAQNPEQASDTNVPETTMETPNATLVQSTLDAGIAQTIEAIQAQTAQAVPTATPTDLVTPSITPTPTSSNTPTPTYTPTPTPTIIPLGFTDDFSDGWDTDVWTVEYGNPQIVNGYLVSNDNVFMTAGDERWTNYVVVVEVAMVGAAYGGDPRDNYISVRQDGNTYVAVVFYPWGFRPSHYISKSGNWEIIPESDYRLTAENSTIRIEVRDNFVTAEINGNNILTYQTTFESGKVGLKIRSGTTIKSFSVSPLP